MEKKGIVLTRYQYLTRRMEQTMRAIGRSEKRLAKLERGRKLFGQVVRNEKHIAAEKSNLLALWDDAGNIADSVTSGDSLRDTCEISESIVPMWADKAV